MGAIRKKPASGASHKATSVSSQSDVTKQLRELSAKCLPFAEPRRPSSGNGIHALFVGSKQQTSKAAAVVAKNVDLPVFRIDLSGVVSKFIGETEKNLDKIFQAVENCGAILFFDEADALFGKRTDVKDSHDRFASPSTDALIQRMERYRGLAILATRSDVETAFRKRFAFSLAMPASSGARRRRP